MLFERLKKKKQVHYATLSYLFSILLLLSALYWFLINNGFTEQNFFIASIGVLIVAYGWGYILATDLLAPKKEIDEKLSHLSKEILHELNIPLATIQANSSMLKKRLSDDKSLKRLDRIDAASIRLRRLYDELVYSINKEIHSIEREEFTLDDIISERVAILREFGRNSFELAVDNHLLIADKIGFEQMIDNLLNNAMKYSDRHSSIIVTTEGTTLKIRDNGIGIDEAELVEIFERYYQADSRQQGEGIGLALVKSYCDEMNIKIIIQSKKDHGTTVILDLQQLIVSK
jgi:signal transduction histidine kinase